MNQCTQSVCVGVAETGELSNARSALLGVAETGEKILLNDFWYFSSLKSTIKKSYFMIFSGRRGIKQCEALLGGAATGVAPTPTR